MKNAQSLDSYVPMAPDMVAYLHNYGKHFSKKLYEFAVSNMWKKSSDGSKQRIQPLDKERYESFLKGQDVTINNDMMYDGMYVLAMAQADFMDSSIMDEKHLALYVKDVIDDPDAVDGQVFNRYLSDCRNAGKPIDWGRML